MNYTGDTLMEVIRAVGRVYVWSVDGQYIASMPLAQMAALNGMSCSTLLDEMLRLRRERGRDPAPLMIETAAGGFQLTLTPKSPDNTQADNGRPSLSRHSLA